MNDHAECSYVKSFAIFVHYLHNKVDRIIIIS